MTGRDRFLIALHNGKPDRLPCQVHKWMNYYLKTYLNGMDQFDAYDYFDMDPVIYTLPNLIYSENDLKKWVCESKSLGVNSDGEESIIEIFHTPEGDLTQKRSINKFTSWVTEEIVKNDDDFELYRKYYPVPIKADWSPVLDAKKKIGDKGIVRMALKAYGQPGPWQSLAYMYGLQNSIYKSIDDPDWTHYAIKTITDKIIKTIDNMGKFEVDLVENGGGAASSTVISPKIHEEFCLPYDKQIHDAYHRQGTLVSYHLCGGLMPLLEIVEKNGLDALETMTPVSMGGDCRLDEAANRIGDKVAFIGGFDQYEGFERGNKDFIQKEVHRLFEAKKNGGYICSPSDHFFFGDPEVLKYFVKVCKECKY